MNEYAKGYIKLEIRDGGVAIQSKLENIGVLEKMALFDSFIEGLNMSTEAAIALMLTYVSMAKAGVIGRTKIDLGAIEDLIGNNEEEER